MSPETREHRDTLSPLAHSHQPGGHPGEARRLVRTIVCAYSRQELPAPWVQVFRRFERAMARAGWRVRVRLSPIEDLPGQVDVLVIPPSLAEQARNLDRDVHLICTTPQSAALAVDDLLRELQSGQTLYAEPAQADEPRIVRHRGAEIL